VKKPVLILCTGNSARSQMAEGLLRHLAGDCFEVFSAGTKPVGLNPNAVQVMAEIGIDIANHRSKSVDEFAGQQFDYLITVCDSAKESCPIFPGGGERIHRSFDDPAAAPSDQQLTTFRRVRDEIHVWLKSFVRDQIKMDRAPSEGGPMPNYLELNVDKFTFKVASDRFYTREGVWLLPSTRGGGVTVQMGLSDYLQQHSGDIAFVNLRPTGTTLNAGDEFAEIETIKVNISLPSPIAGSILQINRGLELNPEFVNQEPYGKGWLVELNPADWDNARRELLDANGYFQFMKAKIASELKETS
jgi:arsenate reductase